MLVGFAAMQGLPAQFDWFTPAMVVSPAAVWPYVFHGWLLVGVSVVASVTGYGRERVPDRESGEVTRADPTRRSPDEASGPRRRRSTPVPR